MSQRKNGLPLPKFDITDQTQLDSAVSEVFEGQDDRATGVLGAAIIDNALEQCLRSAMTINEKVADKLFKPERILGTFGAKLEMCHAFGLIGPVTYNNLKRIKDIRNKFAHAVLWPDGAQQPRLAKVTFKTQTIASWCRSIKGIPGWNNFTGKEETIDVFREACFVIAYGLIQEIPNGKKPMLP